MSNLVLFAVVVLISIYITIRAFIKFRWEYMGWNVFTITYFGGFIGWPLIMTIIAGEIVYWVEENKKAWETMEKDNENDNEEIYSQEERK